jgi:phage repressor protein C with HTH and peptisase S24 domain
MNESCSSGGCSAKAPYALQVLGDSMAPEFADGAVIIVDPDHPHTHGAYVVVDYAGDTMLRQFVIRESQAYLVASNDTYPEIRLEQEYTIRGVVTQQARNRKLGLKRAKHYV